MNTKNILNGFTCFFILYLFCSIPVDYNQFYNDPSKVNLTISDVSNFWKAYDSTYSDSLSNAPSIFTHIYFDNSSSGLETFCKIKKVEVKAFCSTIFTKYPKFYESIRTRSEEIALNWSVKNPSEYLHVFDSIVPNSKYVDIYFIVGNLTGGGIPSPNGIIISLEIYSQTEDTNLSDFDSSFARIISSYNDPELLDATIIHELVHINQSVQNPDNVLLNQSIIEGGAEFITYLVTGIKINTLAHQYGNSHEKELWEDFQIEMNGNNYSNWFYNSKNYPKEKEPELGYFIGFKICESYYNNTNDKKSAIQGILNITDYNKFLLDSKYNPLE